VDHVELCGEMTLDSEQLILFRYAIDNKYWFETFVDDLPAWGFVGQVQHAANATDWLLYTHRDFSIGYNQNKVVQVNLTCSSPISLLPTPQTPRIRPHFTYSVHWHPSDIVYNQRFEQYLDHHFFPMSTHWFSILNSFLLVVAAAGIATAILIRVLRRDLARYERDHYTMMGDLDNELFAMDADYGWKLVHGDVFRAPVHRIYYAALLGAGRQLSVAAALLGLATMVGELYEDRASILTATVFVYGLTSWIAGYVSAVYYHQNGGKNWVKNVIITAALWPVCCAVIGLPVNVVAMYYSSTRAVPFFTMVIMVIIWLLLCLPLTFVGAVIGRRLPTISIPCRVHPLQRTIPEKPYYLQPLPLFLLAGLAPFGSIFLETYMIFTSFLRYKVYYLYGFMLIAGVMLVIVTACVAIVTVYALLNVEDWKWQWTCFVTGGAATLYVYAYAIYFYYQKTSMSGVFQTTFFFGYTLLGCTGLFLALGSLAHLAAERFLRRIYRNVKID
jgi:transmembrane 9 superfamily protein 3